MHTGDDDLRFGAIEAERERGSLAQKWRITVDVRRIGKPRETRPGFGLECVVDGESAADAWRKVVEDVLSEAERTDRMTGKRGRDGT